MVGWVFSRQRNKDGFPKKALPDWSNSSVGKVLVLKAEGHEFDSSEPTFKHPSMVTCTCSPELGGENKETSLVGLLQAKNKTILMTPKNVLPHLPHNPQHVHTHPRACTYTSIHSTRCRAMQAALLNVVSKVTGHMGAF